MVNDTMRKFGWPETAIADLGRWAVMLRPEQPTLGALALVCKEPVGTFGEVSSEAHLELGRAVAAIEAMLSGAVGYEKINYLMLMMVDPDVHFHVLPRYAGARSFEAQEYPDAGWPGPPALGQVIAPDAEKTARMVAWLKSFWSG